MVRCKVDKAERSFLGLCRCGQRFLALSHERALERLAHHERIEHPRDRHARNALADHRKRHAAPKGKLEVREQG